MLKIEKIVSPEFKENCYIIWQNNNSNCLIIDPGAESDRIKSVLEEFKLLPEAILLTHAHIDHIIGSDGFKLDVYINKEDFDLLKNPELNLSLFLNRPFKVRNNIKVFEGRAELAFSKSNLNVNVIPTPGHTEGSCCFLIEGVLFSGDTLFKSAIGRTDFPGASQNKLVASIKRKILTLPDETKVYPGHGSETSIGLERKSNPFLKDG